MQFYLSPIEINQTAPPRHRGLVLGLVQIFERPLKFSSRRFCFSQEINFSFPKDGHKVMELTLAAKLFRVYVGGVSTTPKAMSLLQ